MADLAIAIELSDLSVVTRNPRIQFDEFFPQLSHKRANQGIESAVLIVADDPRQSSPQIADILWDDNAEVPENTADLIDEPDAISNQATANPMNGLLGQLFGGLDGHEAHVWSAERLADGLRIIPVVLVGLHVGRDELWTDQSDIVSLEESALDLGDLPVEDQDGERADLFVLEKRRRRPFSTFSTPRSSRKTRYAQSAGAELLEWALMADGVSGCHHHFFRGEELRRLGQNADVT